MADDQLLEKAVENAQKAINAGVLLNGGAILFIPDLVDMIKGTNGTPPDLGILRWMSIFFLLGIVLAILTYFFGYLHFARKREYGALTDEEKGQVKGTSLKACFIFFERAGIGAVFLSFATFIVGSVLAVFFV